jgi:hypothetical protein
MGAQRASRMRAKTTARPGVKPGVGRPIVAKKCWPAAHQALAALRGLLAWCQRGLAHEGGAGVVILEAGTSPRRATLDVIRRAFESAGVEFIARMAVAEVCG